MVEDEKSFGLVPLKDLVPLRPWRSRAATFSTHGCVMYRYMKVKEPIMEDGNRVYWRLKNVEKDSEDKEELEIPYEGVFEFIHNLVIRTMRRWFDKLLGPICGLPMPD